MFQSDQADDLWAATVSTAHRNAVRDTTPGNPDALAALTNFIADAFKRTELESFIGKLPNGRKLIPHLLDPPASPMAVADNFVHLLQRHGRLDEAFFVSLARERPARCDELNVIRSGYFPGPTPTLLLHEGSLLCGGSYRLDALTGVGGFGKLWRATDTSSGDNVAIKILTRDIPDHDYAWRRAMFIRGTARIAAIDHPKVARVILPHATEQGHDFCVLQYVEGRSLHAEVKENRALPVSEIMGILRDIASGLTEIHARGAIHGDVSPKNILIQRADSGISACLVDFDLVSGINEDLTTMSPTGMPATDPYTAPEWKSRHGSIDSRVDVFGLGMTALYAFIGRALPHSLNDPEAMDLDSYIDKRVNYPQQVRLVLKKACSHTVDKRHSSLISLFSELVHAMLDSAPAREHQLSAVRSNLRQVPPHRSSDGTFAAIPRSVALTSEGSAKSLEPPPTSTASTVVIGNAAQSVLAATSEPPGEIPSTRTRSGGSNARVAAAMLAVSVTVTGSVAWMIITATLDLGKPHEMELRAQDSRLALSVHGSLFVQRPHLSPATLAKTGPAIRVTSAIEASRFRSESASSGLPNRKKSSPATATVEKRLSSQESSDLLDHELATLQPRFRACFVLHGAKTSATANVIIESIVRGAAQLTLGHQSRVPLGYCIMSEIKQHDFPASLTIFNQERKIRY